MEMIGKTISHYTILEKLGEGGMGVVYRAEDTALGRAVALKFLPPELTRDENARERFIHEAQAAAALDHPNICNIHEVGRTDDGQTFIAMAYYEGEDLESRIGRGPLKLEAALDIAVQIAQGLAKAHAGGIVHRDVKPANIIITGDGLVKIMDFGLAKLAGAKLTRTGSTLGTMQYMSPEQARGEEVDARSDLFSLGAVLYEMLTGLSPFRGEYEQAVLFQIMNAAPEPVTSLRTGVPVELERIVSKCLEKDRGERYQTAADFIADLRHLQRTLGAGTGEAEQSMRRASGGPARKKRLWYWAPPVIVIAAVAAILLIKLPHRGAAPEEKSIAVLPFVDMSPQKDQEYFCDGMTEELINRLSNIQALRVPARTSAFFFKGKTEDIREIGSKLNVQMVLEGSVRKDGDELRITAQLINVADGYHIWSERYDRTLEDVFAIQDEISDAIVNTLELKLTPQEQRRLSARPIDDVAAYQCFLKASAEIWRFNEASLDSALSYLFKAVEILGDNALLYSGIAMVYWQYVNIGAAQEEYITRADEYAHKALDLNPDSPQAHLVLGMVIWGFRGDRQYEGIRELKTALALNPNYVGALRLLAGFYTMSAGKPDVALPYVQRVRKIDPLDPWNYLLQGRLFFFSGQYERACEQLRRHYQLEPDNPIVRFFYAMALTYTQRLDEAFSIFDGSARAAPNNVFTKFGLLLKYALLKDRKSVFAEMTPDFQKTCWRDHQWSYFVALSLAVLDAKEESLDWLENAVDKGFVNYPDIAHNPYLDNIRGEERFKKLLEQVKHDWEHLEV